MGGASCRSWFRFVVGGVNGGSFGERVVGLRGWCLREASSSVLFCLLGLNDGGDVSM